jgi:DNA repair protein RecN (Recombination protein N)
VFTALQSAQDRLEQFENSEELRQKLAAEEQELTAQLDKASSKLSEKRKTVSGKFASEVVKELKTLGFLKSEFWVDFSRVEAGTKGFDRVDFIFSANPGEKAGPLRNIASSGEISRVMLALKTILAAADSVPILVFDEIDVNIGGETAVKVGEELRKLAATHQILCISHLPQVAAQAEKHLLVEKTVSKGRTSTMIKELCPKGRTSEIGRMLGGSKAAMEHAADLIANSTASQ